MVECKQLQNGTSEEHSVQGTASHGNLCSAEGCLRKELRRKEEQYRSSRAWEVLAGTGVEAAAGLQPWPGDGGMASSCMGLGA